MGKFEEAFAKLNAAQRKAVETTEGPVMVIAGPGTGKTQLLSVRIGYILKNRQVNPENILCLTYTDAGATAMRKRIAELIGPEGYRVTVNTFHAFGSNVIQTHRDYFGIADLSPASDLDIAEILDELLLNLPNGNPLKKYNAYTQDGVYRLKVFFQEVKKENLNPSQLIEKLRVYSEDLPNREDFIYKRRYKDKNPGDVKEADVEKEREKVNRLIAALELFEPYNEAMKYRSLYDYEDMLQWVIRAFENEEWMLAGYQEKFQYILVDEFQDNNGSQNRILNLLSTYWGDKANLFVVGDDDQSIYSFQGARMHRMEEFVERYGAHLTAVVLEENYRSAQSILDHSHHLIAHNTQRLINNEVLKQVLPGLTKSLRAYFQFQNATLKAVEYLNRQHEATALADELEASKNRGEKLYENAILYRSHRDVEALVQVLTERKIPFYTRKPENLLQIPLVKNILNLCRWTVEELKNPGSSDYRLYQSLYYPYFGIDARDVAQISYHVRNNERQGADFHRYRWRWILGNESLLKEAGVENPAPFITYARKLDLWLSQLQTFTPQLWLEAFLMETGIMAWTLNQVDKYWCIQVIDTLFNQLKEMTARNPALPLEGFLDRLARMESHELDIQMQRTIGSSDGIQLVTAHSSKGLEFDKVYLISCLESNWEKKKTSNSGYKLPAEVVGLDEPDKDDRTEEERRIFYVAATRARKFLQISWYNMLDKDKDPESGTARRSMFTDEWMGGKISAEKVVISPERVMEFLVQSHGVSGIEKILLDKNYLQNWLDDYSLSVTHLSKYLRCPLSFYFENVLRVPSARSAYMGFGNAVHNALRRYFELMLNHSEKHFAGPEMLIALFEKEMKRYASHFTEDEYRIRLEQAAPLFTGYYNARMDSWVTESRPELRLNDLKISGIPVNGNLDRLDMAGGSLRVIDYKTGKKDGIKSKLRPPDLQAYEGASTEKRIGGDYWRQAVFYRMLLKSHHFYHDMPATVYFDMVESGVDDGDYEMAEVKVTREDEEKLMQQMEYAWEGIQAARFSPGCGEEGCAWCEFVKVNGLESTLALGR